MGPPGHALLWNGSANSLVDLNPDGFDGSSASAINGTQVVGSGSGPATDGNTHALLWNGSANSYVDLNPSGFTDSYAAGTNGTQQVGYGQDPLTGIAHALLWNGSANSYVDLHQYLLGNFFSSQASGIGANGDIVGSAISRNGNVAVIWRPCSNYHLAGDLNGDCKVDFEDFAIMANNWLVNCIEDPNNPACSPN